MVDFNAVIEKAVDGLNDNTPELRAKVYDRARSAIKRQLDNIDPPLSDAVKQKQLAKLEDAIRDIEDQQNLDAPSLEDELLADIVGADPDDLEEQEIFGQPSQQPPPQQRRTPPPPPPPPPPPRQPQRPQQRQPVYDEPDYGPEEEYENDYDDDREDDDTYDDQLDQPAPPPPPRGGRKDGFEDWSDPEDTLWADDEDRTPPRGRKARSGSGRSWISTVVILLILIAIGAGVWFYRGTITEIGQTLMALGGDSLTTEDNSMESVPETPAVGRDDMQPASRDTATDNAADTEKFTQRLLSDGRETDEGPASSGAGNASEEGKSMAALTDYAARSNATANRPPAATQPDAEVPAVSQKMFLYEERPGQQGTTGEEGTVVWSVVRESPGENLPPEPAIQAQVSVPPKGLNALITIKRNADRSLPASHLVEIVFALTESFEGGGIAAVQSPAMKQNEQDRGDTLISVPAKITDSFFMIALNDYVEAAELNVNLLKERNWIDVPIAYENGQRAVMALEKGATGSQVFDQVIRAWEARSTSSSQ